MSEPTGCANCGTDTENEPFALCDACSEVPPGSTAYATGRADMLAEMKALVRAEVARRLKHRAAMETVISEAEHDEYRSRWERWKAIQLLLRKLARVKP